MNNITVEMLAAWCLEKDDLADARAAARREFFGLVRPGKANYIDGTGDTVSRERRFMGWFAYSFKLPDSRKPAELAAADIFGGSDPGAIVDSIQAARYVLATVSMVTRGKGLVLKLEDEEFDIEHRQLSRILSRDDALVCHIIPAGRRGWLVGPGWTHWPVHIGPGMQAMLKKLQMSPVEMERLLQGRLKPSKRRSKAAPPQDDSLEAAVERMTAAATVAGCRQLIMSPARWQKLVLSHMGSMNINDFSREIVDRVGRRGTIDQLNVWLGMAMNIWNNTPQPDRGGKSAREISREYYGRQAE